MSLQYQVLAEDYTSSASESRLKSLPGGGLVVGDWIHAFAARGLAWQVTVGTLSTPITGGGAGTVLDADQPELVIDVPQGTTAIPIRVAVDCQTPLIANDNDESEILLAVDRTQISGATSSNGTVETPINMRTDKLAGCPCTVVSAVTSNLTAAPTLSMELQHDVVVGDVQGTPANALWGRLSMRYEPRRPPFIVGPATIVLYWGGTVATSGFASAEFAAIDSNLLTSLV